MYQLLSVSRLGNILQVKTEVIITESTKSGLDDEAGALAR